MSTANHGEADGCRPVVCQEEERRDFEQLKFSAILILSQKCAWLLQSCPTPCDPMDCSPVLP